LPTPASTDSGSAADDPGSTSSGAVTLWVPPASFG
jgi:hypothetical protein